MGAAEHADGLNCSQQRRAGEDVRWSEAGLWSPAHPRNISMRNSRVDIWVCNKAGPQLQSHACSIHPHPLFPVFFFFHMPLSDGAGPALVFHRWGASISEAHLTASKLYGNVRISPGLEPVPKHSFPALLMPCSARAGSCWFLLLGATCRCRASGSHT